MWDVVASFVSDALSSSDELLYCLAIIVVIFGGISMICKIL